MGVILGWIVNFMFTLKWNETSTQIIAFPHNFMIEMKLKSSKTSFSSIMKMLNIMNLDVHLGFLLA